MNLTHFGSLYFVSYHYPLEVENFDEKLNSEKSEGEKLLSSVSIFKSCPAFLVFGF